MTPRDRRAIARGGGLVLLAVLGLRVVPWATRANRALRDRAAAEAGMLVSVRTAVSSLPATRDSLRRTLTEFLGLAPRLVAGQSAADAAASLSGLVSLRAMDAHLRVTQLNQLPDSAAGLFTRVFVRGTLEGDVRGLAQFIGAIESGDPILTLDQIAVVATNWNVQSATAPEVLRIEVTIHGWFLPRAVPAGGP